MKNLLVSFRTDEASKKIIGEMLGNLCVIDYLKETGNRKSVIENADVILSWNPPREFSKDEFASMEKAGFLQLVSAGADHVPFELLPDGLKVAGNVGAFAGPMAEHVLALILALSKNLLSSHHKLQSGNFDQSSLNIQLKGLSCAILGFGGIGKAVARLLKSFGVKILAINTSGSTDEEVEFIGTLKDLETVLRKAEIIVMSLPLSRYTKGLIGEKELSWMRSDAILVNVARGDILDEKAFYEHLKSHPDFKAGIDAWWIEPFKYGRFELHYPFLELPNVLGSPHNSAMVQNGMPVALKLALENIKRFIRGEKPAGVMDRNDYIY